MDGISQRDIRHVLTEAIRRLGQLQAEQAEDPHYFGLAQVYRQASEYPEQFEGFRAHQLRQVTDLPVGLTVYCLPMRDSDMGWRAVIFNIKRETQLRSRLTWVHPQCLRVLPRVGPKPQVEVHHTDKRSKHKATIDIGPEQIGVRNMHDMLILDARWEYGYGRANLECSGHCYALCESLASNDITFAFVLEFAESMRQFKDGRICCHRGKHRSVSAANVLAICFGMTIDMSHAAQERCHRCCNTRVIDNVWNLFSALRRLPELAFISARSLPHILGLPA